jgi:hypothetical protein
MHTQSLFNPIKLKDSPYTLFIPDDLALLFETYPNLMPFFDHLHRFKWDSFVRKMRSIGLTRINAPPNLLSSILQTLFFEIYKDNPSADNYMVTGDVHTVYRYIGAFLRNDPSFRKIHKMRVPTRRQMMQKSQRIAERWKSDGVYESKMAAIRNKAEEK